MLRRALILLLVFFMTSCKVPSNVWTRTDSGAPLRWPQSDTPLLIIPNPQLLLWYRELQRAVTFYNERVFCGQNMLILFPPANVSPDPPPPPGVVLVLPNAPGRNETLVSAHPRTGEVHMGMIGLDPVLGLLDASRLRFVIAVHELGHLLGLAHDTPRQAPLSVMHAVVDDPDLPFRVESEDAFALRQWYSPKAHCPYRGSL